MSVILLTTHNLFGLTDRLVFTQCFALVEWQAAALPISCSKKQDLWGWVTVVACRSTFFPSWRTSRGRMQRPTVGLQRPLRAEGATSGSGFKLFCGAFWTFDCWTNKCLALKLINHSWLTELQIILVGSRLWLILIRIFTDLNPHLQKQVKSCCFF